MPDTRISTDLSAAIVEHVRTICTERNTFSGEEEFHRAFVAPDAVSPVRVSFAPPRIPRLLPSPSDVEECALKGMDLASDGKDPCDGQGRKLDVVWHQGGHVPIELKYRCKRNSDTYGYDFLKDLYRLERLKRIHAPTGDLEPTTDRYAVFLTTAAQYWTGVGEPEPFRLTDGRTIAPGYWVQYNQASAVTRWRGYPPFFLSNPYTFKWNDLGVHGRCLVVRVMEQEAS